MASPPRFIYFDLGNVLVNFDHQRGARQMAAVAGITPQQAWEALFADDLELDYERGDLSTREFYEAFCERTSTRPDFTALQHAAADIFEINVSMTPLVAQLRAAGHRLGILSNTNEIHWQHIANGRYAIIRDLFEIYALSYEIRSLKPEPLAYVRAAEMAGVAPEEIFFADDRPENVAGALAAGFDAVIYTSTVELARHIRQRNLPSGY